MRDNHFHIHQEARHAVAAWIDDYNTPAAVFWG